MCEKCEKFILNTCSGVRWQTKTCSEYVPLDPEPVQASEEAADEERMIASMF